MTCPFANFLSAGGANQGLYGIFLVSTRSVTKNCYRIYPFLQVFFGTFFIITSIHSSIMYIKLVIMKYWTYGVCSNVKLPLRIDQNNSYNLIITMILSTCARSLRPKTYTFTTGICLLQQWDYQNMLTFEVFHENYIVRFRKASLI